MQNRSKSRNKLSKDVIKKLMSKEYCEDVCVINMLLNDKISCSKCSLTCKKLGDIFSNNSCVVQKGFVLK